MGAFRTPCASLDWSLLGDKSAFACPSLHRKFPFPALGGERFDDWLGGSPVCARLPPPPSHRDRTPFSFFALMLPERGLFESRRVSVSVSERRNAGFYAPVSASKNSVPDSESETRCDDDCVGGWQFGPLRLHHPVSANRRIPGRRQIGRCWRDCRLLNSRILSLQARSHFHDDFGLPVSASQNFVPGGLRLSANLDRSEPGIPTSVPP
jgi:hypothetical protein